MGMDMRLKILAAAAAMLGATAVSAHAAEIDLSSFVNANIDGYYNGSVYPTNGGSQTIGGVTFNLAAYPGGGTGVIQTNGTAESYVIPVNEVGVTTVYSIANSAFGYAPATIGDLVFTGSAGASYTYYFTEGDNIRDHATTQYNTTAPNVFATEDFGSGDRLDVQQIVLPTVFASQTLTSITFNSIASNDGEPFLAALTTSDVSAAPEPSTWALMLLGVGGVGAALRMVRRKAGAIVAA
jgi:hypothetical protein